MAAYIGNKNLSLWEPLILMREINWRFDSLECTEGHDQFLWNFLPHVVYVFCIVDWLKEKHRRNDLQIQLIFCYCIVCVLFLWTQKLLNFSKRKWQIYESRKNSWLWISIQTNGFSAIFDPIITNGAIRSANSFILKSSLLLTYSVLLKIT